MSTEQVPSVGRIVHYVPYGTPGGEYTSQCRAGVVTEVLYEGTDPGDGWVVKLAVFNPEGMFFNQCRQSEDDHLGSTWHWPERVG